MQTVDLTDMLRVKRIAPNLLKRRPETFVLYRWQPSEQRRSGIYMPVTRAMDSDSMRRGLLDLELRADELARFDEFVAGPLQDMPGRGAESRFFARDITQEPGSASDGHTATSR